MTKHKSPRFAIDPEKRPVGRPPGRGQHPRHIIVRSTLTLAESIELIGDVDFVVTNRLIKRRTKLIKRCKLAGDQGAALIKRLEAM